MRPWIPTLALLLAAPATAAADAPASMPVQGLLTDSGGTPLNGITGVRFRIYDMASGGTVLHDETQNLNLGTTGEFTAYLGTDAALDLLIFRNSATWLGIQVGTDPEMTPRFALGSVPYAAYAQETAAVPPGAVMMFDMAACPNGWSELTGARGRALVGMPSGGTLLGTSGSALADQESRTHTHGFDAPQCTTSSTGAHTHTTSIGTVTSSSSGSHNHVWSQYNGGTLLWRSFDSAGNFGDPIIDWSNGVDSDAGSGLYPLGIVDTQPPPNPTSANNYYTSFSTNHTHTTALGTPTSSSNGDHTHTCDPAAGTSGSSAGAMPYLQLLVCRKD